MENAYPGYPYWMTPKVEEGNLDYYIESNGNAGIFHFPMPEPPTKKDLFRMFASGEVANPMYTGTV